MDDFDIAQSKIGESAQRVVDRAVEESQASRSRAVDQRARLPRVRAGGVGHVFPGHARS